MKDFDAETEAGKLVHIRTSCKYSSALPETVLSFQPPLAIRPLDPTLCDYVLLIKILVAFVEATAQQLKPIQPPVERICYASAG